MERLQTLKQVGQGWDEYYKRTLELPKASKTKDFLKDIPKNACVLDIGSGSGRWAAAFRRDRPDLTVDLIDANLPSPDLIPKNWQGDVIKQDIRTFVPEKQYDAMWAFDSIFFMPPVEMKQFFHTIIPYLKPGGKISFSMKDKSFAAIIREDFGLKQKEIFQILENEGLELINFTCKEKISVFNNKDNVTNYFHVTARKK